MISIDNQCITKLKSIILVLALNKKIVYYIDSKRLGAPLTQAFAALTGITQDQIFS